MERLVERLSTSTLLDDRRDACRALKSLSRKFRVEVGAQAMDALVNVLNTDAADTEITGYALETLCNITSKTPLEGKSYSLCLTLNVQFLCKNSLVDFTSLQALINKLCLNYTSIAPLAIIINQMIFKTLPFDLPHQNM